MCDYSLYAIQQRLASEGEELVVHRFETGSIGFASAHDVQEEAAHCPTRGGRFHSFINWLRLGSRSTITAVCIPPGTSLLLKVPEDAQSVSGVPNLNKVIFDELSTESYAHHDVLRLPDGRQIFLRDLTEGIRATVLSLDSSEGRLVTYDNATSALSRFH